MTHKRHRWPLWKRSLWQALKSLVRNNPRAALSAAGAGTAYAIKGAAEEVHDALVTPATMPEKQRDNATFDEKAEFVESLSAAERKALAQIKPRKEAEA
jgi:hypothetical protein